LAAIEDQSRIIIAIRKYARTKIASQASAPSFGSVSICKNII
jgi:hypothetical protein